VKKRRGWKGKKGVSSSFLHRCILGREEGGGEKRGTQKIKLGGGIIEEGEGEKKKKRKKKGCAFSCREKREKKKKKKIRALRD